MPIMRLAGVILFGLAIVLGIVATRSYRGDSRKRDNALGQLIVLPLDSPLRSSLVGEVASFGRSRFPDRRNDEGRTIGRQRRRFSNSYNVVVEMHATRTFL